MRSRSSHASSATSSSPRTRCRTPSRPLSSAGLATASRATPARGSSRRRGTVRSTGSGASGSFRQKAELLGAARGAPGGRGRRERDPGRAAGARLHLLPPGARGGEPGRADPARGRRARRRRRSRTRSSSPSRRWRSGSCARSGRSAPRASRSAFRRTISSRSGSASVLAVLYLVFNEGYAATLGTRARPRRSLRRGDPARQAPRRPDARRAGGARAARADAPPGLAPRCTRRPAAESSCSSRTRIARSGTEARIDEGLRVLERASSLRATRPVPAPGGDRGGARGGPARGRRSPPSTTAWRASTRRPVVRLNRAVAVALSGRVDEGLALIDELEGLERLPPSPRRTSGPPPPARPARRGRGRVPAGARADGERRRAPVPRAPASRGLVGRARPPRRGSPRPSTPSTVRSPCERDDRAAEPQREGDLGERPVASADRDDGVARGGDGEVAGVADPGDDDVVGPRGSPRRDARRGGSRSSSPRRLRAAVRGCHDLVEAAGDHGAAALGEQPPDLLGGAPPTPRRSRSPIPGSATRGKHDAWTRREARGGTLILGGGFAGSYVARLLGSAARRSSRPENYMLYTPLLPEAGAGTLEPRHVVVPLRQMCPHAELVLGRATALDEQRRVVLADTLAGRVEIALRAPRRRARRGHARPADPGPRGARARLQGPRRRDRAPQPRPPAARARGDPTRTRPGELGFVFVGAGLRRRRGARRAERPRARRAPLLPGAPRTSPSAGCSSTRRRRSFRRSHAGSASTRRATSSGAASRSTCRRRSSRTTAESRRCSRTARAIPARTLVWTRGRARRTRSSRELGLPARRARPRRRRRDAAGRGT